MKEELLTVGELAKKMDITARTLQYYDKIDLLKPSHRDAQGKRRYSKKEVVKLYQILSMKYLGFSLDQIKNNLIPLNTPDEVLEVLKNQKNAIQKQIQHLHHIQQAIQQLEKEVTQMQEVDFDKYATIIYMLRIKNENIWPVKHMDPSLLEHISTKYEQDQQISANLYKTWDHLSNQFYKLKKEGISPASPVAQKITQEFWNMVTEFTGGDMQLLNKLMDFEESKDQWDEEIKQRQLYITDYISEAVNIYFKSNNIQI